MVIYLARRCISRHSRIRSENCRQNRLRRIRATLDRRIRLWNACIYGSLGLGVGCDRRCQICSFRYSCHGISNRRSLFPRKSISV